MAMMTRKITTFLIVSILYEDYAHTKHRTFFRNLGNIFDHFQYMLSFSEAAHNPYNCNLIPAAQTPPLPSTWLQLSRFGNLKKAYYIALLVQRKTAFTSSVSSPPEIKQQTKFLNTVTSEVTDIFHIHTFTDAHEEQVLTAKDAWRWMLCYKQTVLFITVIPTVILLVTNQWTKIQAFTTGAGEFALWKAKRKANQKFVRKSVLTFFTS